ncbi:hypothetical protein [Marinitoga lauensis]|uniref:hypothetical protein n=1 Tax=Marinitoga lauensis TaxID=2201189 RepID=UPI001010EAF3|nr:hypothetical protein [Marinitoga lauensis]
MFGKKRKPRPKPRSKPKPVVHRAVSRPSIHRVTSAVHRVTPQPTHRVSRSYIPRTVQRKTFQVAAAVDPTGGKIRDTARKAAVPTRTEKKTNFLPVILAGAAAVGGFLLLRK